MIIMGKVLSILTVFFMKGNKTMKKILVFIALIICMSMLFTSCDDILGALSSFDSGISDDEGTKETSGETTTDEASSEESSSEEASTDEPKDDGVDNVNDNIAMLIKLFNKYENVGQLYDNIQNITSSDVEVDFTQMLNEFKKIEVQGNTDFVIWDNGEMENSADLFFAIKDNNIHLSGVVDGEDGGIRASISDSLQMVAAIWTKENGKIEVDDAIAFDYGAIMDEYKNMMEESMSGMTDVEMPFDLGDIKLGGLKSSDIQYKDGKYILKKDSIYKCVENTIDSFIDAAANEGLVDSSFEEEYKEIKKMVKKVFDKIDLEVYFFVEHEVITGVGMSLNARMADIIEAMGVEDADPDSVAGGVEYIKAAFEVSDKGEYVNLEVKQSGYVNKIEGKTAFVTQNGKLRGIEVTFDVDIKTNSGYIRAAEIDPYTGTIISPEVNVRDEETVKAKFVADMSVIYNGEEASGLLTTYDLEGVTGDKEYENGNLVYSSYDNMNLEASVFFDFSKIEKANSSVFEMSLKMVNEYGYNNSGTKRESKDEVNFAATVKTTEANKVNVVIETSERYISKENGNIVGSGNSNVKVEGSIELTTENVTLPTLDKAIVDAMEEAAANPMSPEDLFGNKSETEEFPEIKPEYDYDYSEPSYDDEDYGF